MLSRSSKSEMTCFEVINILDLKIEKLHRRSSYSTLSSYFRPSELSSYSTSSFLIPSYLTSSYLTFSCSTSSKFDRCRLNYPTVLFTILLLLLLLCFLVQWKILQFLLMQKVTILDSRCPISIRTKFMFVATNTTATLKNPIKQLNSYKIRPNTYNYKCQQPPTRAHLRSDYYFALTKQSGVIVGFFTNCSLTVTKTITTTTLLRRKLYTHPTQTNGKLRHRRQRTTTPGEKLTSSEKHQATRLSQYGHNFGQYSGLQSSTSASIGLLLRRFTITTKLIRNFTTMMIMMKANYYILSEPLVQFLFSKIPQKFLFKNLYSFRLSFSPFYTLLFKKIYLQRCAILCT